MATTMEAPKSGVPIPTDDIEEPPKPDAYFLRFANWVSEAMGRPTRTSSSGLSLSWHGPSFSPSEVTA